jgi:hypothetical protein
MKQFAMRRLIRTRLRKKSRSEKERLELAFTGF